MEGPEFVGVELVAGARKVVVWERVVMEERLGGSLKRDIMVINEMFKILQEEAKGIRDVLIHLVDALIQGVVNVQVVTKSTIYDSRVGNQGKTHLERGCFSHFNIEEDVKHT